MAWLFVKPSVALTLSFLSQVCFVEAAREHNIEEHLLSSAYDVSKHRSKSDAVAAGRESRAIEPPMATPGKQSLTITDRTFIRTPIRPPVASVPSLGSSSDSNMHPWQSTQKMSLSNHGQQIDRLTEELVLPTGFEELSGLPEAFHKTSKPLQKLQAQEGKKLAAVLAEDTAASASTAASYKSWKDWLADAFSKVGNSTLPDPRLLQVLFQNSTPNFAAGSISNQKAVSLAQKYSFRNLLADAFERAGLKNSSLQARPQNGKSHSAPWLASDDGLASWLQLNAKNALNNLDVTNAKSELTPMSSTALAVPSGAGASLQSRGSLLQSTAAPASAIATALSQPRSSYLQGLSNTLIDAPALTPKEKEEISEIKDLVRKRRPVLTLLWQQLEEEISSNKGKCPVEKALARRGCGLLTSSGKAFCQCSKGVCEGGDEVWMPNGRMVKPALHAEPGKEDVHIEALLDNTGIPDKEWEMFLFGECSSGDEDQPWTFWTALRSFMIVIPCLCCLASSGVVGYLCWRRKVMSKSRSRYSQADS